MKKNSYIEPFMGNDQEISWDGYEIISTPTGNGFGDYSLFDRRPFEDKNKPDFEELNRHLWGLNSLLREHGVEVTGENLMGAVKGGRAYFMEALDKDAEKQLDSMNVPNTMLRNQFKKVILSSMPEEFLSAVDDFCEEFQSNLSEAKQIHGHLFGTIDQVHADELSYLETVPPLDSKGEPHIRMSDKYLGTIEHCYYTPIPDYIEDLIKDLFEFAKKHRDAYDNGFSINEILKWYYYSHSRGEEYNLCKMAVTTMITTKRRVQDV